MKVQSKASDLRFKHVGNRVLSKLSYRSQGHQISHPQARPSLFKDEQPSLFNFLEKRDNNESENNIYKYSAIEETRVSRFTHHQILLVQKNILVLTLLVIFFGMVKIEADVTGCESDTSIMVMRIMTCCILIIILLVIFRKILILQLEIDQRNVYIRVEDRDNCRSSICMVLRDKRLLLQLILEVIIILPHPAAIFHGITYSQYDENQQALFAYSINDLLSVLMMAKIYLVFRSLVALTAYSSPRAIRLCNYNHVEHGFFYSIKCLQHQYPLACTSVVFAFTSIIFSFGFRVAEGNFDYLNSSIIGQKRGFQSYGNCLWYTFTTMTSIGYGEYIPITPMGKFLASIMSIFGVILNSFLVVALTQYLKMRAAENRSYTTLQRLHEQQRLYDESAGVLSQTIEVTHLLSTHKLDPLIMKRMKPVFEGLKKKIDKTKGNTRLIKAILPQQNKTELMIHEFQLVKDYFKQFYSKQRKIKEKIQKFQSLKGNNHEDVRRSFMNQMQFVVQRPH